MVGLRHLWYETMFPHSIIVGLVLRISEDDESSSSAGAVIICARSYTQIKILGSALLFHSGVPFGRYTVLDRLGLVLFMAGPTHHEVLRPTLWPKQASFSRPKHWPQERLMSQEYCQASFESILFRVTIELSSKKL
jgi:hypothetical protein